MDFAVSYKFLTTDLICIFAKYDIWKLSLAYFAITHFFENDVFVNFYDIVSLANAKYVD